MTYATTSLQGIGSCGVVVEQQAGLNIAETTEIGNVLGVVG